MPEVIAGPVWEVNLRYSSKLSESFAQLNVVKMRFIISQNPNKMVTSTKCNISFCRFIVILFNREY